ncbi:MAG: hypothetical protein QOJ39_1366 [Candidatus Eremiobacteraeota bacterium]|nr:hypothetical protein [Candidatus Eremiobacteraeota bacterium]
MAIELPSKPDVLDERLASLEDPFLAERLFRENPALFAVEPPRTEREVLAWTTRRFGTAVLAVTAALSLAAGYFGYELTRGHAAPQAAPARAVVAAPVRHAPPGARHTVSTRPSAHAPQRGTVIMPAQAAPAPHHANAAAAQHHATAPVQHHVTAPVQHHASAAAAVRHAAPVAVTHTLPAPAALPARHAAPHRNPAHAPAAAPQSAAAQLAAWEAAHPATHARPGTDTSTDPASRTQPRTEPASATQAATSTATTTATTTEPTATTSVPAGAPDQTQTGGAKNPPTSPGGIWTERPPIGGVLGDGHGPVFGAPRDPCTPRGGRTGIVMQAISVLASGRH